MTFKSGSFMCNIFPLASLSLTFYSKYQGEIGDPFSTLIGNLCYITQFTSYDFFTKLQVPVLLCQPVHTTNPLSSSFQQRVPLFPLSPYWQALHGSDFH